MGDGCFRKGLDSEPRGVSGLNMVVTGQSGGLGQEADRAALIDLYVMTNLWAVRGYWISLIIHRFAGSSIRESLIFEGENPDFGVGKTLRSNASLMRRREMPSPGPRSLICRSGN
jgi:hypothetical protein